MQITVDSLDDGTTFRYRSLCAIEDSLRLILDLRNLWHHTSDEVQASTQGSHQLRTGQAILHRDSGGEAAVHRGHCFAERTGFGGKVGAQIFQRGLGVADGVADCAKSQLPAIDRVRCEFLQHGGGVGVLANGGLYPGVELRDELAIRLGQCGQQLHIGISAGVEATEELAHHAVVENDRGIRLFYSHRAAGFRSGLLRARHTPQFHAAELAFVGKLLAECRNGIRINQSVVADDALGANQ